MLRKSKAAPLAALSLAAALLLTGCGQSSGTTPESATAATDQPVEQAEATDSAAELVTAVPEEYKAAAEAGEGWIHAGEPNDGEAEAVLAGNFLVTLRPSHEGDTVLVGVNANTGETTIEAELPGSMTFGADLFPEIVQFGGTHYVAASHELIPEEEDGLSKGEDLTRVHFVELTDGAEAVHYDLPRGEDGLETITPQGPVEAAPEAIIAGYIDDGSAIIQEGIPGDYNEGAEDVWDLHLGDWTVPQSSFSASVETGFMEPPQGPGVEGIHGNVVFFSVNDDLYVADAESQKVIALPEDSEIGEDIKTSPNGRFVTNGVGNLIVDLESGTAHDLRETDDRQGVTAQAVTDGGIVYGTTGMADVRYDTATGEFTALEDGELGIEIWGITPEGTLVGRVQTGSEGDGTSSSIQGVRLT